MRDGVAIYVLIDALGWELIRNRPFLDDLLVDRRSLKTVLGYSSAAIPSILSGRYPSEHGHWNLFYFSPDSSPFRWTRAFRALPSALRENRAMRKIVREVSARLSGYSGYFSTYSFELSRLPYFDLCERRDIYEPGGLESCPSLFDMFVWGGVAYECFNYHRYTDAQILERVPHRLAASPARAYFLYLSQLDSYLHFHIGDIAGETDRFRWYEEGLRRLHRAASRRWGSARMFVFSDHGMTPIRWTHDLVREVDRLGLSVPDEMLPVYDSTMARFWIWSAGARERLTRALEGSPHGRIVPEEELRRLGIWFDDGRYGHLIFLLEPGGIIMPSDMGRIPFAGMHGYHPSEPTTEAVLLASVPILEKVDHITGIYDLVLNDLGLTSGGPQS